MKKELNSPLKVVDEINSYKNNGRTSQVDYDYFMVDLDPQG